MSFVSAMSPALPSHTARKTAVAVLGFALIGASLAASQSWLDRHFLPSFLIPRHIYVRIEISVRVAFGALGVALILGRRSVASWMTRRALAVAAAAILALAAGELVLQKVRLRPAEWRKAEEEPRRQPDARLGWSFVPSRTGINTNGGRTISYTFDAGGYRVGANDRAIDRSRPSMLFAGESVMFGDSLTYDESIPAQVEAALGIQAVNMGVYGYSTDQIYLKLQSEVPRFRTPRAVVTLFMTALFGRNLDDDRPHLGRGLQWLPAMQHARLVSLAGLLVPFRRDSTVENGITITRDVLWATVELARSRGATALITVPHIGSESAPERRLRERILDSPPLPYVLIEIDPAWHVPWDRHPDARAARVIAAAIADRLRAQPDFVTGANREASGAPSPTRR